MSTGLAPVSSRGFNFDEDPYPRRNSRPGSAMSGPPPASENRKRSHSIKFGPVTLPVPNLGRSPGGSLRRNASKKRSGTQGSLAEAHEPPESPLRNRSAPASQQQQQQVGISSPLRNQQQQPQHQATEAETPAGMSQSVPMYPAMRELSVDPPPSAQAQQRQARPPHDNLFLDGQSTRQF